MMIAPFDILSPEAFLYVLLISLCCLIYILVYDAIIFESMGRHSQLEAYSRTLLHNLNDADKMFFGFWPTIFVTQKCHKYYLFSLSQSHIKKLKMESYFYAINVLLHDIFALRRSLPKRFLIWSRMSFSQCEKGKCDFPLSLFFVFPFASFF